MEEKTYSSEYLYHGKILTLRKDMVTTSHGVSAVREIIEHKPAVVVIPLLTSDRLIMVTQYRKAVEQVLLEFPAGLIHPNEDPLIAAKRELQEETGFLAEEWISLGAVYSSPGFCTEKMHFYIAKNLTQVSSSPDEDEVLSVHDVSFQEMEDLIRNQEIQDSKSILGYFWLRGTW